MENSAIQVGKQEQQRGITDQVFLNKFRPEGAYHRIIEMVNDEDCGYWLGIRPDQEVMLYYMGGKILTISANGGLECLDEKYLSEDAKKQDALSSVKQWEGQYESASRDAINVFQTCKHKHEKMAQQEIMLANNRSETAEWFLVDMEYSVTGLGYGRFDMIALSREKVGEKHRIALIELKSGTGAFSGGKSEKDAQGHIIGFQKGENGRPQYGSGIVGHVMNFYQFLHGEESGKNMDRLAHEISVILRNYHDMGIETPFGAGIDPDDIDSDPEHVRCLLMCVNITENHASVVKKVKHYLFADPNDPDTSLLCLERWWTLTEDFNVAYCKLNLQLLLTDGGRIILTDPAKITDGSELISLTRDSLCKGAAAI